MLLHLFLVTVYLIIFHWHIFQKAPLILHLRRPKSLKKSLLIFIGCIKTDHCLFVMIIVIKKKDSENNFSFQIVQIYFNVEYILMTNPLIFGSKIRTVSTFREDCEVLKPTTS